MSDLTGSRLEPQTSCCRDERVTALPQGRLMPLYRHFSVVKKTCNLYACVNIVNSHYFSTHIFPKLREPVANEKLDKFSVKLTRTKHVR